MPRISKPNPSRDASAATAWIDTMNVLAKYRRLMLSEFKHPENVSYARFKQIYAEMMKSLRIAGKMNESNVSNKLPIKESVIKKAVNSTIKKYLNQ